MTGQNRNPPSLVVVMEDMAEAVMELAVMGDIEEGVEVEEDTEEVVMVVLGRSRWSHEQ